MKYLEKLSLAITTAMLLLAVRYLMVKTGELEKTVSVASDASAALPIRDPDDLPAICQVNDFSMTDHLGRTVLRADLLGHVWVADVIFTRCPGPCATMTSRMADLQASIPEAWPVRFVSLTADPEHDTPEILRGYAEEFHADSKRWSFLHATKAAIADLAVNQLKLVLLDKDQERQSPDDLFIHSTTLALVDKHGRLRGAFESVPMVAAEELDVAGGQPAPLDDWQTTLKPRLLKAIENLVAEN